MSVRIFLISDEPLDPVLLELIASERERERKEWNREKMYRIYINNKMYFICIGIARK